MAKITDKTAAKMAETLKQYCEEHYNCETCMFLVNVTDVCRLNDTPCDWELKGDKA